VTAFQKVPAELEVICVQGDELNLAFDASISLVGYTFTALVYEPVSSSGGGWSSADGQVVGSTAATFSQNVVDLSAGQLNLGLTETQTQALSPATDYRWFLRWQDTAGVTTTAVSGTFTVRIP